LPCAPGLGVHEPCHGDAAGPLVSYSRWNILGPEPRVTLRTSIEWAPSFIHVTIETRAKIKSLRGGQCVAVGSGQIQLEG
jgi:hypothetical protein